MFNGSYSKATSLETKNDSDSKTIEELLLENKMLKDQLLLIKKKRASDIGLKKAALHHSSHESSVSEVESDVIDTPITLHTHRETESETAGTLAELEIEILFLKSKIDKISIDNKVELDMKLEKVMESVDRLGVESSRNSMAVESPGEVNKKRAQTMSTAITTKLDAAIAYIRRLRRDKTNLLMMTEQLKECLTVFEKALVERELDTEELRIQRIDLAEECRR
jgi:hypothetical protein